jgi:putative SOS response-associated peptidase YedK
MINARAETLAAKAAYRRPLQTHRCIILADGFYEWKTLPGRNTKQPMLIRMKSQGVFALAGLWDRWKDVDGISITSCTIITIEPNELMAEIHNRMPVILQPEWVSRWLSVEEIPVIEIMSALSSFPADQMEAFAVSTLVNKPGVDSEECIRPIE